MPSSATHLHQRPPRIRKTALALVSLLASAQLLFPYAAVATGYFASPTAGIANVPLPFDFSGGSFGELSDAVNLATGNVYADLGGQSLNNPDGSASGTRAPKITTTATQRLIGFQGAGGSEEIQNDDLTGGQWTGYAIKPDVFIGYTIKAQDGNGCGYGVNGILRKQTVSPGTYRVSFDGHSTGNAFNVSYGMDDTHMSGVTLTNTWQTFTQDINLTQQTDNRMFQVIENTAGNSDWEVLRFTVQRKNADGIWTGNLLTNAGSGDWVGYCGDQTLNPFYRMGSKDFSSSNGMSGVIYKGVNKVPGTYTVQFSARTRLGTLAVSAGVDDHNIDSTLTLTPTWQTITRTFNVANDQNGIYDRDRLFEILENTSSNIEWELKDVSVKSNRALPNQIGNQDFTDSTWGAYVVKPGIQPVYHLKAQDQGCNGVANGLLHDQALPDSNGRYRLTFDGRSTGASFNAAFGTDDNHMNNIQLNNAWQSYSADITLSGGQQGGARNQRAFQVVESAAGNPDWELSGFQIQQWVNNAWSTNLIQNNGLGDWYGYCTQLLATTFYRLNPTDGSNNYSGLIYQAEKRLPGTYIVTAVARTRNGSLPISYGLDDHFMANATLTDQWQNLRTSFVVTPNDIQDYNIQRSFQILENTQNNPAWELQNISVEPVIDTLALQTGDGAAQTYQRIQPDFSQTPSWISRYQGDASVALYKVRATPGTTTEDDWLAVKTVAGGNKIAHHYDQQGNRTTFYTDGEYADYMQTPDQQYRSALSGDPEGASASSLKTQFSYTSPTSGYLSQVRDEYGRTNTYEWNEGTGTLNAANFLLQTDGNNSSYAKRVEYTYGTFANQRVITNVVFRTFRAEGSNGKRVPEQRNFGLTYKSGTNNAVMLASVNTPVMGTYYRTTSYDYDTQNRVTTIHSNGKPDVSLTYGASVNTPSGTRVTWTQSTKVKVYEFTTQGWLRHSSVAVIGGGQNKSPNGASVWSGENTSYGYDANGHVTAVRMPSGAQIRSRYDARGDLREETKYSGNSSISDTWDTDAPAGGYQHTAYAYDNDHQITLEALDSVPSQGPGESTYSYGDVRTVTTPEYFTTANGTFKTLQKLTVKVSVNGAVKRASQQVFNDHGLLTSKSVLNPSDNTAYRTTAYSYGQSARSDLTSGTGYLNFNVNERVYGDQLLNANDAGRMVNYAYDMFGNVSHTVTDEAVVGGWDSNGSIPRRRENIYAYDGFGNQVLRQTASSHANDGVYTAESMDYTHYFDTGEVDYQLNGTSGNVTTYTYGTTSTNSNYGLVTIMQHGIGSATASTPSASITTVHGSQSYSYDDYGRMSGLMSDGSFSTITLYDTLDRPVSVNRPDGSTVTNQYDVTGQVSQENRTDRTIAGSQVSSTTHIHDTVGREINTKLPNGATISTTFDVFGKPIKVTDSRLSMLSSETDRSTYLRYDALGQLIKKLGPVLVNAGQQYSDGRRPYTEFSYDLYGRQVENDVLIAGEAVSPGTLAFPSGASIAVTKTEYTVFDQLAKVTDSIGYTTEWNYDNSGNAVTQIRQRWKGSETDGGTVGMSGVSSVVTHLGYNLAGQVVQQVDGRGNSSYSAYDILGNLTQQTDARGVVVKVNQYLADGLLDSVWEPKLDGSAAPATGDLSKFIATEQDIYDAGRSYPHTVNRALMTAGAAGSASSTTYDYDYAGRPVNTTLPAANTDTSTKTSLTKTYDAQGNVVSERDASGFVTNYSYDAMGRLTNKDESARSGTIDSTAGLGNGLHSTYSYDASGNLTQKNERGLITDYQYNSLGKVIAESRPHTSAGGVLWKLSTYRLDGPKTAQSTYDYTGSLSSHPDVLSAGDTTISVGTGNVTLMEYDAKGNQWAELSYGPNHNNESAWWQYIDGLGQRYKRVFTAPDTSIYAEQTDATGAPLGNANYLTYWKYDANGNLTDKWDTPKDNSSWNARDASDKRDLFSYQYSGTNKEIGQSHTLKVVVRNQNYTGNTTTPITLASSLASITSDYNARDLLNSVSASDQLPDVASNPQNTVYKYYADGRISNINLGSGNYRNVTYDVLGRETKNETNKGITINTWKSDGTQSASVTSGGNTVYTSVTIPTINGLTYSNTATDPKSSTPTIPNITTNTFDATGLIQKSVLQIGNTNTISTTYSYNPYYQMTGSNNNQMYCYSSGISYSSAGDITGESKCAEGSNANSNYGYTLDSRGKRLTSNAYGAGASSKQYNAENQVAAVRISVTNDTTGYRYNDFRYDPYGVQILSGISDVSGDGSPHTGYNSTYVMGRDVLSTTVVGGQIQYTFGRAGMVGHYYKEGDVVDSEGPDGRTTTHRVPAQNVTYTSYYDNGYRIKDSSYSLAIGYNDSTVWTGTSTFALRVSKIATLQAPVTALSSRLRVNPLDVKPGSALPRLADPSKVTQGSQQASGMAVPATTDQNAKPSETSSATPVTSGGIPTSGGTTVGTVQQLQTTPVAEVGALTLPPTAPTEVLPVPPAPKLPAVDPSAVKRTTSGSVSAVPPTSAGQKNKSIFLQEVFDNFDDGTGYKYAVYAQDVRSLATSPTVSDDPEKPKTITRYVYQISDAQKLQMGANKNQRDDSIRQAKNALKMKTGNQDNSILIDKINNKIKGNSDAAIIFINNLTTTALKDGVSVAKLQEIEDDLNNFRLSNNSKATAIRAIALLGSADRQAFLTKSDRENAIAFVKGVGSATLDLSGASDTYSALTGRDLYSGATLTPAERRKAAAMGGVALLGAMTSEFGGEEVNASIRLTDQELENLAKLRAYRMQISKNGSQKNGSVSVMQLEDGSIFQAGSTRVEGFPKNEIVTDIYDKADALGFNAGCSEAACVSKALAAGKTIEELFGARVVAINYTPKKPLINFTPKPACPNCQKALPTIGVKPKF